MSGPLPFSDSICHRCRWHRVVQTARSGFILCNAPELPKYPPQPVDACRSFAGRPLDVE